MLKDMAKNINMGMIYSNYLITEKEKLRRLAKA